MLRIVKLSALVLLLTVTIGCKDNEKKEEQSSLEVYEDKPRITSSSKVTAYKDEEVIMQVTASDMNKEDLDYYIKGDDSKYFTINPQTGELFFRNPPSYDEATVYKIIVGAKDFSRYTGEMLVTITLSGETKPIEENEDRGFNFDYTLNVILNDTKSDGTSWDGFGGAPDIRIVIDDIVHDGKCQDSFQCNFQFSSNKTQWNVRVVDQDIYEHDNVGVGLCHIGVNTIGQAIVDITEN